MQDADDQAGIPGETPKQRINRELIELLNEIRIALPGVQVLFAFLLVVPFGPGWRHTTGFQRHAYVFSIVTAALATVIMSMRSRSTAPLAIRCAESAGGPPTPLATFL